MMSTAVVNIFDLEIEWQDAPNGFSDGVDFKTWLANQVISLRAERDRLLAAQNADIARIDAWLSETAPAPNEDLGQERIYIAEITEDD